MMNTNEFLEYFELVDRYVELNDSQLIAEYMNYFPDGSLNLKQADLLEMYVIEKVLAQRFVHCVNSFDFLLGNSLFDSIKNLQKIIEIKDSEV